MRDTFLDQRMSVGLIKREQSTQFKIQRPNKTLQGNVEHIITYLFKLPFPSLSQIFTVESWEAVAILRKR